MSRSRTVLIILATFLTSTIQAQEAQDKVYNYNIAGAEYFVNSSLAIGDNFMNRSTGAALGFGANAYLPFLKSFYAKAGFNITYFKVSNNTFIGAVDQVNKKDVSIGLGYVYQINNRFSSSIDGSYLESIHRNNQDDLQGGSTLRDNATGFDLRVILGYALSEYVFLTAYTKFDQLYYEIETGPSVSDFFQSASFLQLGVGLKVGFPID